MKYSDFNSTNSYLSLLDEKTPYVNEHNNNYTFITERHVQVMWLDQKYFFSLTSEFGENIKVISPGIWNAEAGPDFKKAHVSIGEKDFFGDIEIHLSDEGWKQHGHHKDPGYNNVILHISLWKSAKRKDIFTENNREISRTYLQDNLSIPEKRILQLIDLDLYPYKKFCGSGKCANTLFKTLPKLKIESLFRNASQWRLTKKRTHLQSRIENPQHFLNAGIAMALGYKQNTENFLDLFLRLTEYKEFSFEKILANGLGLCGLFNRKHEEKWGKSTYYQNLKSLNNSLHEIPLILSSIRPINHPVRRIAFLVHMIKDAAASNYFQQMESHWKESWPLICSTRDYKRVLQELISLLPSYYDSYWNYHYTFEEDLREKFLPLIGNPLKSEIIINTFLPLLQESVSSRGTNEEIDAFYELFSIIDSQQSQKVKYLKHRFFGETQKSDLLKKADIVQGAYQLHHDFCIHYESSCDGCPFVDRYLTIDIK